jgi:signal transduction histidine kinase/DNA-binding response OmpR family regulator
VKKRLTESKNYEIGKLMDKAVSLMKHDPDGAVSFFDKAVELAKNEFEDENLFVIYSEIINSFIKLKKFKKALLLINELMRINEKSGNAEQKIFIHDAFANVHFLTGNYQGAIEHRSIILETAISLKDDLLIALAHNKLGELYKFHTNYSMALEHHRKAFEIYEKHNDTRQLSITHFYIGNCYNWINELDLAEIHLNKSLELADQSGDPKLRAHPIGSMAILFNKKKDFVRALDYFHQSISLAKIFDDTDLQINLQKSFGKLYIDLGQYDRAIELLQESLNISIELDNIYPTNIIHGFLAEAYEKVGDFENALAHHKQYTELCRKISNEQIAIKITELELRSEINKVKQEKEIAEKSSKIKDRFISGISHELRTPLNGIFGMIELLTQTQLTPEQAEYVKTIRFSSSNLLSIINDLIDFSDINQGQFEVNNVPFRLKDKLTEIVSENTSRAYDKKLNLLLKFDDDLPLEVIGDAQRLSQILNNLIVNGIKFTAKGSVVIEAKLLSLKDNKALLLLTVSDTGCGIKPELLPYVFESYAHSELLKHPQSGAGLGLSIVKSLVEKLGGKISISSIPDQGTTIKTELEFEVVSDSKTGRQKISAEPALQIEKPPEILLVEDNKVNQFLGKQLLSKLNYKVTLASNAEEAIKKIKSHHFDLVLMDVQLPGMSGYELTRFIRHQLPSPLNAIPVVALTAYASEHEMENAFSSGMNDYLTKPYSPSELSAVIRKNLKPANVELQGIIGALNQRLSGSKKDVIELAEMILKQAPLLCSKMVKASQQEKWKLLAEHAHKLKSTVGLFNHAGLMKEISEIEEHASELIHLELLPEKVTRFNLEMQKAMDKLKSDLEKIKISPST